jgi:hypothetical protein
MVFPSDKEGKRQVGYRKRHDGETICRGDRECRARSLAIAMGKDLGQTTGKEAEWLWCRLPREWLYQRMDIRPGKAQEAVGPDGKRRVQPERRPDDAGWRPRFDMTERVLACILYCSFCYPVSKPYAVQLAGLFPLPGRADMDPDDILVAEPYYRPIPLKEKDIARILNEWQPNVSRALKQLVATKMVQVDEDHVIYPAAKILDMSIEDRRKLYELPAREGRDETDEGKIIAGAPKTYRAALRVIDEQSPDPDLSTDIFRTCGEANTSFNSQLQRIRAEKTTVYETQVSRFATLYPELLQMASPTTKAAVATTPHQSRSGLSVDVGQPPVNELYDATSGRGASVNDLWAAGVGKGALAKLPAVEDRSGVLVAAKLAEILGEPDDPGAERIAIECRKAAPGITDAELAYFLGKEAKRARKADNPVGLLIRALPPLLKEDKVNRLREEMRLLAQADALNGARERGRIIAGAREVLRSPETDEITLEAKQGARETLAQLGVEEGEV